MVQRSGIDTIKYHTCNEEDMTNILKTLMKGIFLKMMKAKHWKELSHKGNVKRHQGI